MKFCIDQPQRRNIMSELRRIPNIGAATERDLIEMGYTTLQSLKGKSAEELYAGECALRGFTLDRCQLYLLRAVEYYVNTPSPDPEKCRWWYWKDDFVQPSPCGAVCTGCGRFPKECGGCRKIEGKVFWLQYAGMPICPIYSCCVQERKMKDCGSCGNLPCSRFVKDPTVSDDQNTENLKKMLSNLRRNNP